MPTPSPLAALAATLATVCQQAQQHQQLLSRNEAATRAVLIDPVLRALGWDTADVTMVEPERTVENKQSLDYVLKSRSGAILAVVEAKKLGEPLDKIGHVGALIGYAFSLKPTLFLITDGLSWHGYSPGHLHYEPVVTLQLSTENLLPTALQLLQLLDAAHGGHGLAGPVPAAQVAVEKPTAKSPKPIPKSGKVYIPLTAALALDSPGKPTWLRLPDGSEHPLKTWKDILTQATELVLQSCPKLSLPIPDKAGKKVLLVSREQPKADRSFTITDYQGKPAYIYTNYSSTACVGNAVHVLKLLPTVLQKTSAAISFS